MSPRSKQIEVDQLHQKFESTNVYGFTIPEILILTVLGFFLLVVVILSLQSVKRSIQDILDERRRKKRDVHYETSGTTSPIQPDREETAVEELSKERGEKAVQEVEKMFKQEVVTIKKSGGYSRSVSAPGTSHTETRGTPWPSSGQRHTRNRGEEYSGIHSSIPGNTNREVGDASRLPSATGKKWKDIINTAVVPPNTWNQSSNMMETTRVPVTHNTRKTETLEIPRYPVLTDTVKDITEKDTATDLKNLRMKNRIILDAAALPPIIGRRRGNIPDTLQ